MLTASIVNNNLIIYSSYAITGVNTNFLYIFGNNVFKPVSSYNFNSNSAFFVLKNSVNISDLVKIAVYPGGITTTSNFSTTIIATNNTVFLDNSAPSLIEIFEQGSYNYTSYVYSNFITGISSQNSFPSSTIVLKRNPPYGKVTINEGLLGPMNVYRFAAISSTYFTIPSDGTNYPVSRSFAFDYNSYGNHNVNTIVLNINSINGFGAFAQAYLTINQDYFSTPSPTVLGVSTILDFSNLGVGSNQLAYFTFSSSITLAQGKYWIIFTPTASSSIGQGNVIQLQESALNNYYTDSVYQSPDSIVFSQVPYNGVAFTVITDRGIVLPSVDAVYDQLDQPQPIQVQYGDQNNPSIYTQLAVPTTNHYIKKNLLDSSLVYAIETLVESNGQNQFQVNSLLNGITSTLYTMIANSNTTNIERFNYYNPTNINSLYLNSLGDYYAQSPSGTVLVSAIDSIGISTIEVSTNINFPASSTTRIYLNTNPQKYIANIPFNFGNLGDQFNSLIYQTGITIKKIFSVIYNNSLYYLLISDNSIYLYDGNATLTNIFNLSNSIFINSIQGSSGIILSDSLGNIYNYANGLVTTIGTVQGVPLALTTQLTTTYIGVGTIYDVQPISNRKRIYSLNNLSIVHQPWSTLIPEPEVTFIYATNFGLIIGSYDQNLLIGKVYVYYNSQLSQIYSSSLRPDIAYFSTNTNILYVGFAGSDIKSANYSNGMLSGFSETGLNVSGSIFKEIYSTRIANQIFVLTNTNAYIFNELNYYLIKISTPSYSSNDQNGLLTICEPLDLNLKDFNSSYYSESFSNVNFDPTLNGFNSSFRYTASGSIVFNGISTLGYSTNFYLQIPNNSVLESIQFDTQSLSTTIFSGTFYPSVPKRFFISVYGNNVITGAGTICLYNGYSSSAPILGVSSLIPPKTINWFLNSGSQYDIFGFADGSVRSADVAQLSSNQYTVYARFTDIFGNRSGINGIASDIIYNQIQQQINKQALPSGRIVEIDTANNINSFTPKEGGSAFIYSGSKFVRQSGVFESDPFYAADVTSWNQIQVLTIVPGAAAVANYYGSLPTTGDYGTSVTLYVKTASSLLNLQSEQYINSYQINAINNGTDFGSTITSILANIGSLSGTWLQFKLVLTTASLNITPIVRSVLITYNGSGKSVFITKTFNTAVQSTIVPTPTIRRGILTANFVLNGGTINFAYTTDPNNINPNTYTTITPNVMFTLPTPSTTIKFAVVLNTASSTPVFFDNFGIQLDLGANNNSNPPTPNDLYFMPPMASFGISQYYDNNGIAVSRTYQFINQSIGIISSYNWSFGTTFGAGISTFYPIGINTLINPPQNSQNPIVQFTNSGPFTVGLFVSGFVDNGVIYNSELFTKTFIAT